MEIPEPKSVPSHRIRDYLYNLRNAILGVRPVAGFGIHVSEHAGQGTLISVDQSQLKSGLPGVTPGPGGVFSTIELDVCVDGSPETHTFVITS